MTLEREDFKVGDPVDVIVKYNNAGKVCEKLKRARVLEVVRRACRLRYEDGSELMVRFNLLRPVPKDAQVLKSAPPPLALVAHDRFGASAALQRPLAPVHRPIEQSAPAAPAIPIVTRAPASATGSADIDASLAALNDMARELLEPIDVRLAELKESNEALDEEAKALEVQREQNHARMKDLYAQRERIQKLIGGAR
jgi:hypothetical protein